MTPEEAADEAGERALFADDNVETARQIIGEACGVAFAHAGGDPRRAAILLLRLASYNAPLAHAMVLGTCRTLSKMVEEPSGRGGATRH